MKLSTVALACAVPTLVAGMGVAFWLGLNQLRDDGSAFAQETRVRYPEEENQARRLCKGYGLMYWWVEDPRKNKVTMHARCAGQRHVQAVIYYEGGAGEPRAGALTLGGVAPRQGRW